MSGLMTLFFAGLGEVTIPTCEEVGHKIDYICHEYEDEGGSVHERTVRVCCLCGTIVAVTDQLIEARDPIDKHGYWKERRTDGRIMRYGLGCMGGWLEDWMHFYASYEECVEAHRKAGMVTPRQEDISVGGPRKQYR